MFLWILAGAVMLGVIVALALLGRADRGTPLQSWEAEQVQRRSQRTLEEA